MTIDTVSNPFWRSGTVAMEPIDTGNVRVLLDGIMSARNRKPDVMLMSLFFADTLEAVQQVYDRFGGRNWRRVKREMRKAHEAVARKHRGRHG